MKVEFHQENLKKPVMVTISVKNEPDLTVTREATKEDQKRWDKTWAEFKK